ncbi:F-box/kelch-repeat protein SKIP11 isoform X2 [Pyrus x bretschneideri]|uniref:F-box/kelch-repeat protein SKIP11 isoform X2 n=1 Tax=Pyrus x bretschneideri TaxID=225117 RepID=UPI00202F5E6B|nr:F-box/kelch-repeat protein SKIP11 isoform X2 [Pyrus x bretschneideri]
MLEGRSCLLSRVFPSSCQPESEWPYMTYRRLDDISNSKRPLGFDGGDDDEEHRERKLCKRLDCCDMVETEVNQSLCEQSEDQQHSRASSDSDKHINRIGRDNLISCLIRCSRSDYGSIASLNQSFRSLVRSGELYKLRRQNDVIEHWIYFSCHLLEWEAFDPNRGRWMHLPRMTSNECFMCSDKESCAVGTELLVFGGCDSQGNILSSAELYNSETQTWEMLPSMKKPRKMCSGVFMDEKFYVIGGIGGSDSKVLTCGEEYDLTARTWTEIPNMSPGRSGAARETDVPAGEAPPLVAVVNNELYAADYADMEVRKYDKERRVWLTVGRLPERAASMNGWGLAFRACGDQLIVIGGPRALVEGFIEINAWVPGEGPPQWNLLARKQLGNFVYNCAVMGC